MFFGETDGFNWLNCGQVCAFISHTTFPHPLTSSPRFPPWPECVKRRKDVFSLDLLCLMLIFDPPFFREKLEPNIFAFWSASPILLDKNFLAFFNLFISPHPSLSHVLSKQCSIVWTCRIPFISHRLSSCFKKPLSVGQLLRRCLGRRRCSAALIARKNIFHEPGWRTIIPSVKSFPMALSKINMREDTLVHTVHRSSVGEFTAHN